MWIKNATGLVVGCTEIILKFGQEGIKELCNYHNYRKLVKDNTVYYYYICSDLNY